MYKMDLRYLPLLLPSASSSTARAYTPFSCTSTNVSVAAVRLLWWSKYKYKLRGKKPHQTKSKPKPPQMHFLLVLISTIIVIWLMKLNQSGTEGTLNCGTGHEEPDGTSFIWFWCNSKHSRSSTSICPSCILD